MDAIEYLKAVLRETFTHFAGGLVGARDAYLESAKSHDTPLVRLASDEEVSLEMREAHERSMDDAWNSPACSDLVGNANHSEAALEAQKNYEHLLHDMRNSPVYSYMGGNIYHRIDHNH